MKQNFITLNILVSETSEEAVENIANGLFVLFYIKFKIIIFKLYTLQERGDTGARNKIGLLRFCP